MSGLTIIRDGQAYRVPPGVEAAIEHAVVEAGAVTPPQDEVLARWLADPEAVEAECAAAAADRIAAERANAQEG